jgi:DDE family transposase
VLWLASWQAVSVGRRATGAVHVDRVRSRHTLRSGEQREYTSYLLRRSFRKPDGGVGKEKLANLSALPVAAIDAIDAVLKGKTLVDAQAGLDGLQVVRSRGHGHVALVDAMARRLGLAQLLGPACRERDLAFALVVSRVARPKPKIATRAWWDDVTVGPDLVGEVGKDELYAAMDWLAARQEAIEAELASRHLSPGGLAMFDLSSSWVEGSRCELAARGYSRDGKRGVQQIEYGLLTDPAGRPVAVRVFPGDTADPDAFTEIVTVVRDGFGLAELVLVGDRGMITKARIEALAQLNDDPDPPGSFAWITCLRAPSIKRLAAEDGPLQMSLFDTQDLAEITHPDYPGERLIACRNPVLAAERARKREDLLHATEKLLAPIAARVAAGRLRGADQIGVAVGKVINHYKVGKHIAYTITGNRLSYQRRQTQIDAESALDGIYVIRTPLPADRLAAAGVVTAYKMLAAVERDFRSLKTVDLELRPIHHHLADRVRAHVLICMLACYLTWHLRRALAPLTYADEHPPIKDNPLTPAQRSGHAATKAGRHADQHGHPLHSFRGLLDHLATLTRNTIRLDSGHTFDKITTPTQTQQRAFDLLGIPIPITLGTSRQNPNQPRP